MSQNESLTAKGLTPRLRRLALVWLPFLVLAVLCHEFLEHRTGEMVLAGSMGAFCLAVLFRMAAFPPVAGTLATQRASIAASCSWGVLFSAVLLVPPFPWRGFAMMGSLVVLLIGQSAVRLYLAWCADRNRG